MRRWLLFGLALLPVSVVAAQSRETLETKVTAVRGSILLEWSKKHPWDAQLAATPPYLVAEYRTSDGRLGVDCFIDPNDSRPQRATGCFGILAEGTPGSRTWRFRLPEQISRAPVGPVCLAIRLPNQRVLPIRRTDESHAETSRFRYPEWESAVVARAAARQQDTRVAALKDSVTALGQRIARLEASHQENGWTSEASCQNATAPEFVETGGVRRPVAPDSLTDALTSLVCILKVGNAPRVKPEYRYLVVQPPAVLDQLLQALSPAFRARFLATRSAQIERYRRDWAERGPQVEAYRNALEARGFGAPHFGRFTDFILLQSLAADSAERDIFRPLAGGVLPDSQRIAGYVGANLEAYSVCRSDGARQIATAREAAIGLRSRTSALQDQARRQVVSACQASFGTLAALKSELQAMTSRLAATGQGQSVVASGSLPDTPQPLNRVACTP